MIDFIKAAYLRWYDRKYGHCWACRTPARTAYRQSLFRCGHCCQPTFPAPKL